MSSRSFVLLLAMSVLFLLPARALAVPYFRTYENAVVHWREPLIDVAVDPAVVERFGPRILTILQAAADAWRVGPEVPAFRLPALAELESQASSRGARVWVAFGQPERFVRELAITVTTTEARSGEVLRAEVWLNPERPWAELPEAVEPVREAYDLLGVLTHEFGHVLGLDEDVVRPLSTMHPEFRRGEVHQRTLEVSDENSISSLYQEFRRAAPEEGCAVSPSRRGTGVAPLLGLFVVFVARLTCVLRRALRAIVASRIARRASA